MQSHEELKITQLDVINQGHIKIDKIQLKNLLLNKTVTGTYEYNGHRIFKSYLNPNGNVNGQNDLGSYEEGKFIINEDDTFSIEWDGYWENWTANVYKIDNKIKFYDIATNMWRTTFFDIQDAEQTLEV